MKVAPDLSTEPKLWRLLGLFISLWSSTLNGTFLNSLLHLDKIASKPVNLTDFLLKAKLRGDVYG